MMMLVVMMVIIESIMHDADIYTHASVVKFLRSRPKIVIKHPDLTSAIHDTIQADISAWMCITLVTHKYLC